MDPDKPAEQSPMKKKPSLTPQDFTIKHSLGKGAYGDVFLVVKNSDRKTYAMKQIQKKKLERQQKEYQAMVQKELLSNFKHPGIVKLRSSFQDKQSLYFVLEYCQGGQFISFIKANIQKLNQKVKTFYIAQIVNLLEYIHKNGVTHRDLKPENLMLDRRGHLRLIDFGTAQITNATILKPQFKQHIIKLKQKADQLRANKQIAEQESQPTEAESPLKKRRSTFVGTCYYISPELLEQNYCPPSADLWALGCIIYQLYYLQTPFKDNYQFAVFEKIKKAEVSFPKNEAITDQAIDLIKRLLVKNPEERLGSGSTQELSFKQLKAHPYFKGIDIDKIYDSPLVQRSEKEMAQSLQLFKGNVEQILKKLNQEGKQLVKYEIIQQKTFTFYTYSLLIYCSNNKLFLINSQDIQKMREIHINSNGEKKSRVQASKNLILQEEDRVTQFRSAHAQEWLAIILKI